MDLGVLLPRGPSSPCDELHPDGNTVDVTTQMIHLQGRPVLLFVSFLASCIAFVAVLLILIWSFIGRPPKENGLWFRNNHGLKGWTSLTGIIILTLVFFLADAVFRFMRFRHLTVSTVYLWVEEVRDKPQSIAEFWLFILIFASCEEAAVLGNVAQQGGGAKLLSQTTRWTILILAIVVFLAQFGIDLAHKYFVVDALDPSDSTDPSDCHVLTIANTIFIAVSIGLYGLMTIAGLYGTIIAAGFEASNKGPGFHSYRRYWTVLIGSFLARSMLCLAYVMIFDWFNMSPYDLLSMIYAIVYAVTTIVLFFCIAGLIKIPNPFNNSDVEFGVAYVVVPPRSPQRQPHPQYTTRATSYDPGAWAAFKQSGIQYTQIPSDQSLNRT